MSTPSPLAARLAVLLVAGIASAAGAQTAPSLPAIIPMPSRVETSGGPPFVMTASTPFVVEPGDAQARRVAMRLAEIVGSGDDTVPPVVEAGAAGTGESVRLVTDATRGDLGAEGYQLAVSARGVTITAATPAGLFYGTQTLRQLMPPRVEYTAALFQPLPVPAVEITDRPRFAWRGMMLDVARHFFEVSDVERVVDLMALYKLNRLHLHLSDDQGWRIEIPGRPALTETGGQTQVGGGPGGFYTVQDYDRIVRYAAERFVTVVPEIDLPGHTNAALASLPELSCDGLAREPYTGTRVGFSSVCVDRDETYAFVDDVVRELAARTPGDEIHLGGDEVRQLSAADYARFVARAQATVRRHGKRFMGWDEVAEADLMPGAVVQVWRPQRPETAQAVRRAVAAGAQVVLSPSDRVYLDMKTDSSMVLGLTWAGLNGVRDAYAWEPAGLVEGVPEAAIRGVEAPLWAETLGTIRDVEFMAFPRLAGVAEIGWSPRAGRSWAEYRLRLAQHGSRWTALGVSFFRSPEVPWRIGGLR